MMGNLYTNLLKGKAQGRDYLIQKVPRPVKGERTRLFGRAGGPWCQHVSDVPKGTMVRVPIDDALTWLRKRAYGTITEKEAQAFEEFFTEYKANAIKEPTTGQILTGPQAMGHMLLTAHLDKRVKA